MKSITFIGGDNRNYTVSKMLSKKYNIYTYGLKDSTKGILECISLSEYIILPIPFSTDDENIYAPQYDSTIKINGLIENLFEKTIVGGKINEKYIKKLEHNGCKVIDITKSNEFIQKNAIPTAEGVIKLIIENTDFTIDGSRIAVLGFGNVGKKISELLHNLNADIFSYDIKKQEVANIASCGYNVLNDFNKEISKMDVIVNTVPEQILNEEKLKYISKKTLIIDVASIPGGVDYDYSKENGYNVIHALGLPGKIAPKTSAKYVKDILENLII